MKGLGAWGRGLPAIAIMVACGALLVPRALTGAARNLEIYWIDAEGGAATLIVAPSGQSMLVDTANRTPDDRDAKRILAAARLARLSRIDMLLTTHFHDDQSVGFLLRFGKFDFIDLGDLTWNYEQKLVCPNNLIGTVDLYQTTHHGLDRSNSPQFMRAIQPKVVVMNNGPRKGGVPSVFETLRKSTVLEDIWQGHLALATPKEINTDERMIANLEPTAECTGNLLKASVAADGTYTMTNMRNGFTKSYRSH